MNLGGGGGGSERVTQTLPGIEKEVGHPQGHPSPAAFGIPGRASMAASPGGTDPLQGRRMWATSFTLNTKPTERRRDIKATAPQRDEQHKVEGTEPGASSFKAVGELCERSRDPQERRRPALWTVKLTILFFCCFF